MEVLVAGGYNEDHLNTAELYHTLTGTWIITGNINNARRYHTASLLTNENILIIGGTFSTVLNSAELYHTLTQT